MDALKNIVNNVPGWELRLGDLGGQIAQRQIELARLGEAEKGTKTLKARGSTESLLQKDEPDAALPSTPEVEAATPTADQERPDGAPPSTPVAPPQVEPASPGGLTPSAIQKQSQDAIAVAQARARAQVRKKHRSQSVVSVEGNPGAYRSRSMILVYYDSYVQSFFEELVKFVSASRNLLRKAKMAAKVAAIKRMAEMDTPDDEENDDEENPALTAIPGRAGMPSLRYLGSSRQPGALPMFARAGAGRLMGPGGADMYDEIDKGLEYVQGVSERAAHQFLRDGDCSEETENILRRLVETRNLAQKEMDRILREEPDLAKDSGELQKIRTHRPAAMRRDLTASKELSPTIPPTKMTDVIGATTAKEVKDQLEVDMDIDKADDAIRPAEGDATPAPATIVAEESTMMKLESGKPIEAREPIIAATEMAAGQDSSQLQPDATKV